MKKQRNLLYGVLLTFLLLFTAACGQGTSAEDVSGSNGNTKEVTDLLETSLEVVQKGNEIEFHISLTNKGSDTISLPFSSGQQFEIIVKDVQGQEVYRYSIDKMFTMALQEIELAAGESLHWTDVWDTATLGENGLASGSYQAIAEVKVMLAELSEQLELSVSELSAHRNFEYVATEAPTTNDEENGAGEDAQSFENNAFRSIEVVGEKGSYTVTGEARVFEGVFGYSVTEGHMYYIDNEFVQLSAGGPEWAAFTLDITIPEDQLPVNGMVTLELFEESAKDGSRVNVLSIPLEWFKPADA